MNRFWRLTLLGLFAAAGVGVALGVALSKPAEAETTGMADAATFDIPAVTSADGKLLLPPPPAHHPAAIDQHSAATPPLLPVVEMARPPIASQPVVQLAQSHSAQNDTATMMDQFRKQLEGALKQHTQGQAAANAAGPGTAEAATPTPGNMLSPGATKAAPAANKPKPRITRSSVAGDDRLSINIQDSDLRDVLALLSEQGGLNILPSPSVQGKVSAALNEVDIDTALDAILRSTGFIAKREGKFIYVGTPADFKAMDQALDQIGTRVYHLNYVRAADVQSLITPILTPGVGSVSVTAPADQGIAADDTRAGGNQFAGGDSILVRDYVAVLDQVDAVIQQIDCKPAQVSIEAMILSVALKDTFSFGVDFEFLRSNANVRLATGSPLGNLNQLDFKNGGLKFAYLDDNTGAFISALETIGDTNVIASPRLMCVNKARAEILIGEQLGYVNTTITETSTAQNVQFLEVGAQLRLRPFISSDGLIRMEVHPELSTGSVQVREGFTLPEKRVTQVTTNIMVPDGCTVIIGGLMREDLLTTTSQVPLLGSMPGVGFLFRKKQETTEKREILVLITPHIVCEGDNCCEGDKAAGEFHRRQSIYADQMSPIGKRYLGRRYFRLAQSAWAKGDQQAALRFVDLAIHFDPENRAAIDLRVDIWNGNVTGDHTLVNPNVLDEGAIGPGELPPGESLLLVPGGAQAVPPGAEPVPLGVPVPQGNSNRGLAPLPMGPSRSVPAVPDGDGKPMPGDAAKKSAAVRLASARPAAALDGEQLPAWLMDDLLRKDTAGAVRLREVQAGSAPGK